MIQVRQYRPQDQTAIDSIQIESQADIDPNVPTGFFDDLASIQIAFKAGVFLVAENAGSITGFAGLHANGEIVRMRVAKSHRRLGIASVLLEQLIHQANLLQLPKVFLHTLVEQTAARALYEAYGFDKVGEGQLHGNQVIRYEYKI